MAKVNHIPTGRKFIVEFMGKQMQATEYKNEYVKDPIFEVNGKFIIGNLRVVSEVK